MDMSRKIKGFISYAHEDKAQLEIFLTELGALRYLDFKCDKDLIAGMAIDECIEEFIMDGQFLIVLLSKFSRRSKWCKQEIEWAIHHQKSIITICIDKNVKRYTTPLSNCYIIDAKEGITRMTIDELAYSINMQNNHEAKANIAGKKRQMGRSFVEHIVDANGLDVDEG